MSVVGYQDHVPRHVVAVAAQAVVYPGTDAWTAEQRRAAVQQELGRIVVALLTVHRSD